MKLDTEKTGLCAIFKPYKAAILKHLYDVTTSDSYYGVSSGTIWVWLNANAEKLGIRKMSRSSIMHALKDLIDDCLIKCHEEVVSSGTRNRYSVVLTPDSFASLITSLFTERLESIFEGEWWSFKP